MIPRVAWALVLASTLGGLPARGQQETPAPVVAVFLVENRGTSLSSEELVALTDYLATTLGEEGRYQIVPREEIRKSLMQQKQESYRECYEQSCQIEIGRELAAQFTVSASISRVGSRCIITAAMYDLKRATTVRTATAKVTCIPSDLLLAMESIASKLGGLPGAELKTPVAERDIFHFVSPERRSKSVVGAFFWSLIPSAGMYYVESYGWGMCYSALVVGGGIAAVIVGNNTADQRVGTYLGASTVLGGMVASMIHSMILAAIWEHPGEKPTDTGSEALGIPAVLPGSDSHPALVLPIFSGRF